MLFKVDIWHLHTVKIPDLTRPKGEGVGNTPEKVEEETSDAILVTIQKVKESASKPDEEESKLDSASSVSTVKG